MTSGLKWMSSDSKEKARQKAKGMVRNYGWPQKLFGDFKSSEEIDEYHKARRQQEMPLILKCFPPEHYRRIMLKSLSLPRRRGAAFDITVCAGSNFLLSPALVSAWYQPERNSITFPYASFNPPYYSYEYPQAYNYGGQGGTAGHELVHGFDDQGK
ncbi:hypothetical protein NECAME_01124 [Necator americanus]|uniref:Peptidase M13 C-terminal domain-containing protein n=1 Tax=Necator americanus TaxID=51031 RepID=W2SH92_NECAM|nr:hypothetical protein NECAME_01124 [Necator americanus]ETN69014.1 hypothetical protein NECAME_01124 [Necator americanus]